MLIKSAKDLDVYKLAYSLSMDIFTASKKWPAAERYALTDQCRRASRSVCANMREAWAKRRYKAHFISKLTDCDGEVSETDTWIDYAYDCGYISEQEHQDFTDRLRIIGAKLGRMIMNPDPFLIQPPKSDLRPLTSDYRPPTSDLCPPTSILYYET